MLHSFVLQFPFLECQEGGCRRIQQHLGHSSCITRHYISFLFCSLSVQCTFQCECSSCVPSMELSDAPLISFPFLFPRLSPLRLLSPQLEPSASLFVGPLLSQLVRRMPAQMAPILRPLVAAIVARMASKRMPSLSISLLLVFARLVRCCGVCMMVAMTHIAMMCYRAMMYSEMTYIAMTHPAACVIACESPELLSAVVRVRSATRCVHHHPIL